MKRDADLAEMKRIAVDDLHFKSRRSELLQVAPLDRGRLRFDLSQNRFRAAGSRCDLRAIPLPSFRVELELIDRERRLVERRIKQAGFPVVKQLESFDFKAIPGLNKMLVLDLARGDYIDRRENVILLDPSGVGKTHVALALGLAACQKGLGVRFTTASHLVHEMIEARDEKRLLRLQDQLARVNLLIVDELGYVPLSQTGSELLFDVFSRRYENGATVVTSNLSFQEWTTVFASERLTGALLDRITHHVHILEMNADSYRLKQSRSRRRQPSE